MKSVSASPFTTKFMPKIASSGGGRVRKWPKLASIDMWMVPYVELFAILFKNVLSY